MFSYGQTHGTPSQVSSEDVNFKRSKYEKSREVKVLANIKSAKKRIKVIEAKTLQNKMFRSQLKTERKKFDAAVSTGDKAAATEAYKEAVKKVDQSVAHGILHKNTAAHKKSKLTKKLNAMA